MRTRLLCRSSCSSDRSTPDIGSASSAERPTSPMPFSKSHSLGEVRGRGPCRVEEVRGRRPCRVEEVRGRGPCRVEEVRGRRSS